MGDTKHDSRVGKVVVIRAEGNLRYEDQGNQCRGANAYDQS